jgi:low affinity Fe/Cu permease
MKMHDIPLLTPSDNRGVRNRCRRFAHIVAAASGSPIAFSTGVALIALWAISGPYFHYSESWQLIVNTTTTIVTFLMVFVIQNTQARDSKELHVKLDELLRAVEHARNTVINCADLSDEELQQLETDLQKLAKDSAVERLAAIRSRAG